MPVSQDASGDEVSSEARMMAERVRERAAGMPDAADIAGMAMDAPRGDMTPAEIRELATEAIQHAERVSFLLGKLAALLGDPAGGPGGQ
jgi:hypothetical protein